MKVLHTSDWHIGRRFKGLDLGKYQRRALDWLVALVKREHVDVVCISGDVYDTSVPSAESVELLDGVLTRLTALQDDEGRPQVNVIVTPGNHDSARKLGYGAHMVRSNLHLRCEIGNVAEPVIVERRNKSGDIERLAVYAVPYLDPDVARPVLLPLVEQELREEHDDGGGAIGVGGVNVGTDGAGDDGGIAAVGTSVGESRVHIPRSHEGVMRAALSLIVPDLKHRRQHYGDMAALMMAHAFVSGASPSESERSIAVGGVDSVPAGMFSDSGLDYLALGHLHRPQQVTVPAGVDAGHATQARYSGSLLSYSFSERCVPPVMGNGKSVVLLDIDSDGMHHVHTVPVESGQPALAQISGSMKQVIDEADQHQGEWVTVTVQAEEFPHGMYQRIDAHYEHALEKNFQPLRRDHADGKGKTMANLRETASELDVIRGFVQYTKGREPNEDELAVLRQAIEQVHAEEVAR